MDYFVYILKCNDKTLYVGQTDNIDQRIAQHNDGLVTYTSKKLPVKLVYLESFQDRKTAFLLEQKLKKWSRKKKESFINSDWNNLKLLAKKNFKK